MNTKGTFSQKIQVYLYQKKKKNRTKEKVIDLYKHLRSFNQVSKNVPALRTAISVSNLLEPLTWLAVAGVRCETKRFSRIRRKPA